MAEILITGGAGNLGRTLASALREDGHTLRILDIPACDFSFFDGWERTTIQSGDILDTPFVQSVLDGVNWVFHLAALLPPVSELDRKRTFRVNVEGTGSLLAACGAVKRPPTVVFASSISIFGDTSAEEGPIGPDHPPNPNDCYAESKVEAEKLLFASGLPYVDLRISAIALPVFLDPPEPWPFTAAQRIELIALSDLVTAMTGIVRTAPPANTTLLLAGGTTWQMSGEEYVREWGEVMEIPFEEMHFRDTPGWLNWYDTRASQELLGYQKTPWRTFLEQLREAVEEALA